MMELSSLPIPDVVVKALAKKGITSLYPPQEEAIRKGLLDDNNIVVAIPTASGKTLLALLACIRTVVEREKKALYLSPLRALAYEKYQEFKYYFDLLKKRTVVLTGDYDTEDNRANFADVIIATNEKVDSAIRHKAHWIKEVGVVVSDEVHLINDSSRGPTLEVVLAQLKQISQAQIIALSATIKNADEIARWLEAELVVSDWRPVKLNEGVILGNSIIYGDGAEKKIPLKYKDSLDNITYFILSKKQQALVFCTTRNMAEATAKRLAKFTKRFLTDRDHLELQNAIKEIERSGERTRQSRELIDLLKNGIAYHHAGLTTQQRRIIENYFRNRTIKILSSTPTLAAGINLPARYVIIKSIYRYDVTLGSYPIPVLEFKQQSGRAGRPQYDKEGDALIIAKNRYEAQDLYLRYIVGDPEDITSKIAVESALRRIVLGQVATENVQTYDELMEFFSQTFYGYQRDTIKLSVSLNEVIKFLREEGMLAKDPDYLIATNFGRRVSELYIDPLSGSKIREGLLNIDEKSDYIELTDLSFLHLICATPDIRFVTLRKKEVNVFFDKLQEHENELLLDLPSFPYEIEFYLSYLKTALILLDWINEIPEDQILERYSIGGGDIRALVSNAEWLLYSTSEIAKLLGYEEVSEQVKVLQQRVINGINEELLELVSIPGIGRVRARALYDHGFKTLEELRKADPNELLKVPGIGKEIIRSIYDYLLGDEESKKQLESINEVLELEDTVVEEASNSQRSLDDFF